jgi:hypothetical protein
VATSVVGRLQLGQALVSSGSTPSSSYPLVSLVTAGVITSVPWTLLSLVVMCPVASFTSARRIAVDRWAALPIAAGDSGAGPDARLPSGPADGAGLVPIGESLSGEP